MYKRLKLKLKGQLNQYCTTVNTILKKSINIAKKTYYETCLEKYRNNIKKTWSTIKYLLEYFLVMSFIYHSGNHSHYTRHINNFVISRTNYEYTKRCIRITIVYILNDTRNIIKDKCRTHSLHGLFIYAKQNYLNKYETYCHFPNCYVCKLRNQY